MSKSKKKSYMDSKGILSEGFLNKVFQWLASPKFRQLARLNINPKVKGRLTDLNNSVSKLERTLGLKKGELARYDFEDFLKKGK